MSTPTQSGQTARPVCQFSGEACSTQSSHYRKVISHIFGRNKKCTIGIPDYVWIYYCRKHYQRSRYRTGEWPFRQCDLAMDTVRNMREWGGVESFNLQLRRRETKRTSGDSDELALDGQGEDTPDTPERPPQPSSAEQTPSPLRPVTTDSTLTGTPETPHPRLVADKTIKVEEAETYNTGPGDPSSNIPDHPDASDATKKKKSPTIVARPVPEWLHNRLGNRKSFQETLQVLRELRRHLLRMSEREEIPHFPDIEILPNLRPHAAAVKSKDGNKGGGRVSENGAVKKTGEK